MGINAEVSFARTSKADLPHLPHQPKQLALVGIARVPASVPSADRFYVDGLFRQTGARRVPCSPPLEPPGGTGWVGRRFPNSSSSTYCELHGLLNAVALLTQRRLNGDVICESQSALHALTSKRLLCRSVVFKILSQLTIAHDGPLMCFL